jgi:hypothetical protein
LASSRTRRGNFWNKRPTGCIARSALQGLGQGRHQGGGLAFELELAKAFEQHGGLVRGLHRFARHFQQGVQLDRVDADAFIRLDHGVLRRLGFVAALDAVPARPGRRGVGGRRGSGLGCGSGSFGFRRIAARRDHRHVHPFPIQAVGAGRSAWRRHHGRGCRSCRLGRGRRGSLGRVVAGDGILQQALEVFRHRRQSFRRRTVVQVIQLVGNEAGRLQRGFDRGRRDRGRAGAQGIEQVLGQVAGGHQRRQSHEARATLDGVERAEHRVQRFLVIRIAFEVQQVFFDIRRKIQRLDDEILEHFIH